MKNLEEILAYLHDYVGSFEDLERGVFKDPSMVDQFINSYTGQLRDYWLDIERYPLRHDVSRVERAKAIRDIGDKIPGSLTRYVQTYPKTRMALHKALRPQWKFQAVRAGEAYVRKNKKLAFF